MTNPEWVEADHYPPCVKYISGDDLPCICDLLDEHAALIRADEWKRTRDEVAHQIRSERDHAEAVAARLVEVICKQEAEREDAVTFWMELARLNTREQIAADIEALPVDGAEGPSGRVVFVRDVRAQAYRVAARIARGGDQ